VSGYFFLLCIIFPSAWLFLRLSIGGVDDFNYSLGRFLGPFLGVFFSVPPLSPSLRLLSQFRKEGALVTEYFLLCRCMLFGHPLFLASPYCTSLQVVLLRWPPGTISSSLCFCFDLPNRAKTFFFPFVPWDSLLPSLLWVFGSLYLVAAPGGVVHRLVLSSCGLLYSFLYCFLFGSGHIKHTRGGRRRIVGFIFPVIAVAFSSTLCDDDVLVVIFVDDADGVLTFLIGFQSPRRSDPTTTPPRSGF